MSYVHISFSRDRFMEPQPHQYFHVEFQKYNFLLLITIFTHEEAYFQNEISPVSGNFLQLIFLGTF